MLRAPFMNNLEGSKWDHELCIQSIPEGLAKPRLAFNWTASLHGFSYILPCLKYASDLSQWNLATGNCTYLVQHHVICAAEGTTALLENLANSVDLYLDETLAFA